EQYNLKYGNGRFSIRSYVKNQPKWHTFLYSHCMPQQAPDRYLQPTHSIVNTQKANQLHVGHHALIGATMGVADAIVTTPFYYFKNMLQLRQKARAEGKPLHLIATNPFKWF